MRFLGAPTVAAVHRYLEAAGITEGPLFRRIRKGDRVTTDRLGADSIRTVVRKRTAAVDGITGRIGGHSPRRPPSDARHRPHRTAIHLGLPCAIVPAHAAVAGIDAASAAPKGYNTVYHHGPENRSQAILARLSFAGSAPIGRNGRRRLVALPRALDSPTPLGLPH